jgi:hypothetical protein
LVDVLKSIKLDYHILKATYKILPIIYLLAIILAFSTQPTMVVVIIAIFSAIFSGSIFAIYDKNHLDKLYGILPLGKYEVVLGRYIYALFFGLANSFIAVGLTYIISVVNGRGTDSTTIAAYMFGAFLYYCLSIGVSFPIFFKFNFTKSFIFTVLPLYLVGMSGVLISRNASAVDVVVQIIKYLSNNPAMIWVSGLGTGLILLGISFPFSFLIFKGKEL